MARGRIEPSPLMLRPGRTTGMRAWLPVLIALGAAVAGCDRLLSLETPIVVRSGDGGAAPASTCGISTDAGACGDCVTTACCTEANACATDALCDTYEACLLPCGTDYACRAHCLDEHPSGTSATAALDRCVVDHCSAACGLTCGLTNSYAEPAEAQGCVSCVQNHACSTAQECGRDLTCTELSECAFTAPTIDRFFACTETGVAVLGFGLAARLAPCLPECDVGRYWSCAGRVTAPYVESPDTVIGFPAIDVDDGAPVVGAAVSACDVSDVPCAHPLATETTDGSGLATLDIPVVTAPVGFAGYFQVTSPTTYPFLFFQPFPLSVPKVQLAAARVPTPNTVSSAYATTKVTPDSSRGSIEVTVTDCHWIGAPDVEVTLEGADQETFGYYPVQGAYQAGTTATDGTGLVIFLNVPAGAITVDTKPNAVGHVIGKTTVLVRPNTVTSVFTHPNL